MNTGDLPAIFIALVAAWGSWMAHRASSKANIKVNENDNRTEMEKEAYKRARDLDTESIARLKADKAELQERVDELEDENETLKQRLAEKDEKDDNKV